MSEIAVSIARLGSSLQEDDAYGLPRRELLALRENLRTLCGEWTAETYFDEPLIWEIIFFVRGAAKWLVDGGFTSQSLHSELANIETVCLDEIRRRLVNGRKVASK